MCIAGGRISDIGGPASVEHDRSPTAREGVRASYANHTHLFFEGDRRSFIFIIESGWVKLYRTLIDGQRQIVGFANAGSILGLESEHDHVNGCEAITPVTVRAIPASRIGDLYRSDPAFAEQMLRQVGRQLGAAQAQIATIGAQCADQKLATFLLSIANLCDTSATGEFELPMRRGDMAEFLGLRLETVSRKMTDFQRRGWVQMTSLYHCRLKRRDLLAELAQGADVSDLRAASVA